LQTESKTADFAAELPTELSLPASLQREILAQLRGALPNEGCGLLATRTEGFVWLATRFFAGTNLDASPVRFTMDPVEVESAFAIIQAEGLLPGAIVHSHPTTPATPSLADLRRAYYPAMLMVIASFSEASTVLRAWKLRENARRQTEAEEIPVVVLE
jgi:[CysO sulfur-carrier protein]-S-L-cysteine hydrolase